MITSNILNCVNRYKLYAYINAFYCKIVKWTANITSPLCSMACVDYKRCKISIAKETEKLYMSFYMLQLIALWITCSQTHRQTNTKTVDKSDLKIRANICT